MHVHWLRIIWIELKSHLSKMSTGNNVTAVTFRWNISIVFPLDLSTPTEMGYIEPLVENKNSTKQQRNE